MASPATAEDERFLETCIWALIDANDDAALTEVSKESELLRADAVGKVCSDCVSFVLSPPPPRGTLPAVPKDHETRPRCATL
jgi:hypothetical protein